MRDLRNQGDRVLSGEHVIITRDGKAVARFEPLARDRTSAEELVSWFRGLPELDPQQLRADIVAVLDQRL